MDTKANILPLHTYAKMFPHLLLPDGSPDPTHLKHSHIKFVCNKSSIVQSLGCTYLDIALPGKKLITSKKKKLNSVQHRPITDATELKKKHPKCFDVIGKFEGEYSFVTNPSVPQVQHAQYNIPIKLQKKTEVKHDEMVEQAIITPVI